MLPQVRHPASRVRWWSTSRAHAAFSASSALALELLPLVGVFIVLAAGNGIDVSDVALPFWYALAVLALAQHLGTRLRRQGTARVLAVTAPLIALSWLVLVRVSPGGYGQVSGGPLDMGWLNALAADMANGARNVSALIGLLVITLYLWYRGIRLGTYPPRLDDVLRRLKIGMAVLVVAAALLAEAPPSVRGAAIGAFTLLLPAEVFCGLVASALARLVSPEVTNAEADRQRPWVSGALLLAGSVVGAALLLGLVINGGSVSTLLGRLGPVGSALDAAARWFSDALGQLLGFLFGAPIRALKGIGAHVTTTPSVSVPKSCTAPSCTAPDNSPPPVVLIILAVVFYAFLLLILILICARIIRLLRQWMARPRRLADEEPAEEREPLDGRSLFRRQFRDLFRRRRHKPSVVSEEALDPTSVRALYREVLRSAARAGLPRLRAETPDEFATRAATLPPLAQSPAEVMGDLARLTDAYGEARYGNLEQTAPDRATTGERARRILKRLRAGGR